MSSALPVNLTSEQRIEAAEARAAEAEAKRDRLTYRVLHLTRSFDAQVAEIAALKAQVAKLQSGQTAPPATN